MSLDIEILCAQCNSPLEGTWSSPLEGTWSSREGNYMIKPCAVCLEDANYEGIDEGYQKRVLEQEE